jgi:hypothetical protein
MRDTLCIADRNGLGFALAGVRDGRLTVLSTTEETADVVRLVEYLAEAGVTDGEAVLEPGAPGFTTAAAAAVSARRHEVLTFDGARARAWLLIRTLPLGDEALRKTLLVALPNMSVAEATDLATELEGAAAELAAIEQRANEAMRL